MFKWIVLIISIVTNLIVRNLWLKLMTLGIIYLCAAWRTDKKKMIQIRPSQFYKR